MFAVIFEVQPRQDRWDDYLGLAKQLRPELETIDGFIDNERFGSKKTSGRVLSLSTWRDEKAVVRWRTHGEHHGVQEKGRTAIFEDYHLRVGEITFDTGPPKNIKIEQQHFDETEAGNSKFCTITEVSPSDKTKTGLPRDELIEHLRLDPRAGGLLDHELFESITNPGKLLVLGSWRDEQATRGWTPVAFEGAGEIRHRRVRVIRDYGMFDRREAPQYYPDIDRTVAK